GRVRAAALRAAGQDRRARPHHHQGRRPGGCRLSLPPDRRSLEVRAAGESRGQPAMRLRLHRTRQSADGGRRAQEAGAGGRSRPQGLGLIAVAARPHPLWSVAAVLLTFIFSGAFIQLLPVAAPAIIRDWALADTALAPPMAMTLVGSSVGTVLGGIFSDV